MPRRMIVRAAAFCLLTYCGYRMYQAVHVDGTYIYLFGVAFALAIVPIALVKIPAARQFLLDNAKKVRSVGIAILLVALVLMLFGVAGLLSGLKPVSPAALAFGFCGLLYLGWMTAWLPTMIEASRAGGWLAQMLQKLR